MIRPTHLMYFFAAALFVAESSVNAATIGAKQTFDADAGAFVANTTSSVVAWVAAGGNPDGHIQSRKDLSPPVFDIGALTTSDYTGNFITDGVHGVSVDLNFMTDNVTRAWIRFRKDPASNGWLTPLTNVFAPTDTWMTYSVNFNPAWSDADALAAGWLTDEMVDPLANPSPAFANVMASVGRSEVRIRSVGSTLVGIDNFFLVPEPSALTLMGLASLLGLWFRRPVTG